MTKSSLSCSQQGSLPEGVGPVPQLSHDPCLLQWHGHVQAPEPPVQLLLREVWGHHEDGDFSAGPQGHLRRAWTRTTGKCSHVPADVNALPCANIVFEQAGRFLLKAENFCSWVLCEIGNI